jgi:hypothetical protein
MTDHNTKQSLFNRQPGVFISPFTGSIVLALKSWISVTNGSGFVGAGKFITGDGLGLNLFK